MTDVALSQRAWAAIREAVDRQQCADFVAMCNGKPASQKLEGAWLTFEMLARWRARGFRG